MRRISLLCVTCAAAMMVAGGCASMSGTLKGGLIGGGGGTAVGAGIGALAGGGKGRCDRCRRRAGARRDGRCADRPQDGEAEGRIGGYRGGRSRTVTDTNGLDAIKVTFDTGILFPTNGTALNASAKAALDKFAISLLQNPDTDVTVFGHTDSTGTLAVNERISLERAQVVRNYLETKGIASTASSKSRARPIPSRSPRTIRPRAGRLTAASRLYLGRPGDDRQAQEGTLQ